MRKPIEWFDDYEPGDDRALVRCLMANVDWQELQPILQHALKVNPRITPYYELFLNQGQILGLLSDDESSNLSNEFCDLVSQTMLGYKLPLKEFADLLDDATLFSFYVEHTHPLEMVTMFNEYIDEIDEPLLHNLWSLFCNENMSPYVDAHKLQLDIVDMIVGELK